MIATPLIAEIVEEAVDVVGSQAELARRMLVAQSAISRWIGSRSLPEFESCLRLARITGRPPFEVLTAGGHDSSLLSEPEDDTPPYDPIDARIRARLQDFEAIIRSYPKATRLAVIEANIKMAELLKDSGAFEVQQPTNGRRDGADNRPAAVVVEKQPTPRHRGQKRGKEDANRTLVLGCHPLQPPVNRRAARSYASL